MVVPQCGRCGGKGGPHTCLRDQQPEQLRLNTWAEKIESGLVGGGTLYHPLTMRDELQQANDKLAAIRTVVIDNKPAPLYRILAIIDGET